MKLIVDKAVLQQALSNSRGIVENRNTIPILGHILLAVKSDQLTLKVTDLEIELVESIHVKGEEDGQCTVPAGLLYDIIRKMPDGVEITLEAKNETGRMTIKAGGSNFALGTLPASDFPEMTDDGMEHGFKIAAKQFKSLLDHTNFAISTDEARYFLNGVFMHHTTAEGEPVLRCVATDGHRLARYQVERPEGAEGMPEIIIPKKAVQEIRKLLDQHQQETIQLRLSNTKIKVEFDKMQLTSKLIDGKYPNYEQVIPKGHPHVVNIQRQTFASAVDRVAIMAIDRTRAIKLHFQAEQLSIHAQNQEAGSATEDVTISFDGGNLNIGFNARYLLDIIGQTEGSELKIHLKDQGSPVIILDSKDDQVLYVLMPMRV